MAEVAEIWGHGREHVAHAVVLTDLRAAADTLWSPDPEATAMFHYDKSAAGLSITAVLLEDRLPQVVSIETPSVRMQRTLRQSLGDKFEDGTRISFAILDPREAESNHVPGVHCVIADADDTGEERTLCDIALPYTVLQEIYERGGVYEKRSIAQRLGRWTIRQLEVMGEADMTTVDDATWQRTMRM